MCYYDVGFECQLSSPKSAPESRQACVNNNGKEQFCLPVSQPSAALDIPTLVGLASAPQGVSLMARIRVHFSALFFLALLVTSGAVCQVAVTTFHNDNARMGQNIHEGVLTPSNVNAASFGQLFFYQTGGGTYAQPLYVPNLLVNGALHNVVYVVTEQNKVFAFDADGSQTSPLWSKQYGTPISTQLLQNDPRSYLSDTIGIQSTPVIDIPGKTMYFVSATQQNGSDVHLLHGIDITNGSEKFNGPVQLQGSVPGNGDGGDTVTFNASAQNQRPGLLLSNGTVYIAWGSYDDALDFGNYHGWVMAYDAATLRQKAIFNTTPNGSEGSTWALGALAADSGGNIYVGAANGSQSQPSTDPTQGNFANSYLKLDGSNLAVLDYFIPSDWLHFSNDDLDMNGGGAVLLPDQAGAHPHLLVWGTKGGNIYVADRDNMGQLSTNDGQLVQSIQAWSTDPNSPNTCTGDDTQCVRTLPAYWNNSVYFIAQNHGVQQYSVTDGVLSSTPISQDTTILYTLRGAAPSITSNDDLNNGIVWAVKTDADTTGNGKPATLFAYDANNAGSILYSSNQNLSRDQIFPGQLFSVPTVANGKVYVAGRNQLYVFGLLASQTAQAPTIQLGVNPTSGGAPLTVTASTSGSTDPNSGGSIVSSWIDFGDGTVVNSTTANHTYSKPGIYTVLATVYGSSGKSSHTSTTVTVSSNSPPFGFIDGAVNNTNGSTMVPQNGVVHIRGWAADKEDGSPVTRVQVLLDGASIGNATLGFSRPDVASGFSDSRYTNSGWALDYNIGNAATGTHTVTAIAYDSQGITTQLPISHSGANTFTVTGDTAPFGFIDDAVNSTNGSTTVPQNGVVHIRGWAADKEDGSPVTRVQVLLDGASIGNATLGGSRPDVAKAFGSSAYTNSGWILDYNVGNAALGTHTISAIAYDSQGAVTTLPISHSGANTFTVTGDTAPFGFIDDAVNSTNGSTTVPQNGVVHIRGWAADKEDGSPVTRVQVLLDGASIGNATLGFSRPDVANTFGDSRYTNSGWVLDYNVGGAAVGMHTVSAIAYDSQGAVASLPISHTGANTFTVTTAGSASSISHVLFMLQENHSFDNYFGRMGQYKANKGFTDSFDGVPLNVSLTDANGKAVSPYHLATVCTEDLAPGWDPVHLDVDGGKMDKFPLETQNFFASSIDSGGRRSMGYYDWNDLPY
jgi:PKD repeat protein